VRTIDLSQETPDLTDLIALAQQEPVLLVTANGQEFLLAEADDFEQEAEQLRSSSVFQAFLEARSASQPRFSLEEIEREIDQDLAAQEQKL
jgi:PHD/YefM family antitoxin component YafN of YafNO toxin-antitoxin module